MKKLIAVIGSLALVLSVLAISHNVFADSKSINFESPTYNVGSINGQDGWTSTGAYDQGVVSSPVISGAQSFRISNSVTSGSFGDQTFAPALTQAAGETGSNNSTFGPGPFQSHFESQFTIKAIPDSIGDTLSVSPDQGNGARMSYLSFDNESDGIHVTFYDVQGTTNPANFVSTTLPTLDSSVSHTIKFSMDFMDGPSNDVVNIYIDGSLAHTGTSWENYYRYDVESNPTLDSNFTPTVRTTLFREGGTAVPGNAGKGFLIDDLSQMSAPTTFVTTNAANAITTSDATLNGTNGTDAAIGHSFWVSTSSFATTSPSIPAGVYSTPDMGAIAANTAWSASLSSLTTSGVPGNMPAVTPNTTYYFVAWSNVGGTWHPGAELHFTTSPVAVTQYTLTYTAGANGTLTGTTTQTVNQGASGTPVTAVANTGFHFTNWSDASTANPRTDTNAQHNISVTANFAANAVSGPTNKDECKDGGWMNGPYKNQGQCVSHFASGK